MGHLAYGLVLGRRMTLTTHLSDASKSRAGTPDGGRAAARLAGPRASWPPSRSSRWPSRRSPAACVTPWQVLAGHGASVPSRSARCCSAPVRGATVSIRLPSDARRADPTRPRRRPAPPSACPKPPSSQHETDREAECDVIGPLRGLLEGADRREAPTDQTEVERGDREPAGRAPQRLMPPRQNLGQGSGPEERERQMNRHGGDHQDGWPSLLRKQQRSGGARTLQ